MFSAKEYRVENRIELTHVVNAKVVLVDQKQYLINKSVSTTFVKQRVKKRKILYDVRANIKRCCEVYQEDWR